MKLINIQTDQGTKTGVMRDDSHYVDVSAAGSVLHLISHADARAQAAALAANGTAQLLAGVKLAAPVTPGKIIAIGLNYSDHAAESGAKPPSKPIVFAKFSNTLAAHGDTITWYADQTPNMDYEAEFGIVIGHTAYRVSETDALSYVGGYVCANDLSARDLQSGDEGKQWVLGKTLDGTCPIGPCLTTSDDIPDPQALSIKCILNGQVMQNSSTAQMIFGVAKLVSYLSHYFTLNAGDLIITGTPPGVGAARKPPVWLKDGDTVTIEIEKIGALTNTIRVL